MMIDERNNLTKIGQMARILGVTVSWLREEAEAGRIPHLRAGDRFLFHRQTVLDVLTERAAKVGETDDD